MVQGIASAFQKKLSNTTDKLSLLVVQTFAGFTLASVILLATQEPVFIALSGFDWVIAVIFGLLMLAISYLFLVGFKYTNLNTGSILVSSELLFGPLFAFLLINETLGLHILIGGVFTVLAAVFANIPAPKQ